LLGICRVETGEVFPAVPRRCENAGMDDTKHAEEEQRPGMSRRLFFGRAAGVAGAAVALMTLTACPGGGDGDDDGDDDGGDDD
jgi:hypothetical protein